MADVALTIPMRRAIWKDLRFAQDALIELVGTASTGPCERDAQERFCALAAASELDAELVTIPAHSLRSSERYVATGYGYQNRPNAIVTLAGGSAGAVVVNSHIDTVQESAGWTRAVAGEVAGNRVYGLGSADAKGSLVAALVAARAIKRLGMALPGDLIIQSVVDEEGTGNGTLGAILALGSRPVRLAIVMEPTDLQVAYGHRGMLAMEARCPGRSAHGAIGGGVNAIAAAARVVSALEDLAVRIIQHERSGYLPPSLNVGMIAGGREVFTTPDDCRVSFSIRYAPGQKEELLHVVRDAIEAIGRSCPEGYAPRLEVVVDFDAAESGPRDSEVVGFLEAAAFGRPGTGLTTFAATCDARHFRNLLGVSTLIYGPGRIADAHAPDEHVDLQDVLTAAAAIATFAASAQVGASFVACGGQAIRRCPRDRPPGSS